jgi:hypothetical protein
MVFPNHKGKEIKMEKEEKIELVQSAQMKIYEAIDLLKDAVGDDGHAMAYLVEQLEVLAGDGHGFLSNDFNCDKLIEQLENSCEFCGDEDCDGECQDEECEVEVKNE